MKKAYQKPIIYIEEYELAQSIAQDCGYTPDSTVGRPTHSAPGVNNCGWELDGDIIFIDNTACTEIMDPDEEIGGVGCYNTPTGNTHIFASA